jgi:hypothetical protein
MCLAATVVLLGTMRSVQASPIDDALAFWHFDTDFTSATGSFDGAAVGDASLSTGGQRAVGQAALELSGAGYLQFGDIPLSGDFSLTAWVNPANSPITSQAVLFGDADNNDWIRIETNTAGESTVRLKWGGVTTTVSVPDNTWLNDQWQHFTLVRSGSDVDIYRDAELVRSVAKTQTFTPERLGHKADTGTTNFYEGFMDEVGVWDRALSITEIGLLTGTTVYDSIVAAQIDVGDGDDTGGVILRSTDDRVTLAQTAQGRYEPAIDGSGISASNGILLATVRQNEQDDPVVGTPRYATVEAARDSGFSTGNMGLSTQKMSSIVQTPMSADTAMAWFDFTDGWIGAHVEADGTVFAGNGIDNSHITVVEPTAGSPAYDVTVPGIDSSTGMMFAIASSSDPALGEQVHYASTAFITDGWRIAVRDNFSGDSPEGGVASEFSLLYMSYDTAGLIGGRVGATGSTFDAESAGAWSVQRLGLGRYFLTIDGFSPEDGMLLLSLTPTHPSGYPQDDYLTYDILDDGYEIWVQDVNGSAGTLARADSSFVFAFIPLPETVAIPEPGSLMLLAVSSLWAVRRRRV